ncbi:AsmA family protein [Oceaniglobus ichthyenteri]|uniref:AsmA family protein n=1 Tax=Oceaniglobus ichthyenteri TaxID=2136177 RepID=UPI000D350CED|nr:AsmA family protein [Oceaniglobus ichthyenteri]
MRWIIRGLLGLVVLGAVAIVALLFLPADKIADLVENRFQQTTGRTLTVTGDVRPTIWPTLGVTTGAVTVANAAWSDNGPMLKAEGLSVAVDLARLLRGDIRITGVSAIAPEILLEIGPDGMGNWEMGEEKPASGAATSGGGLPTLTIDKAEIKRGSLRFVNRQTGTDQRLTALDATLTLPSMQGKATFDLSALINGQAARLNGNIEGLAAFLERGAVPTQANLSLGGAKIAFAGRAGLTPLGAAGRLSGDLGNLSDIMAALGQGPVKLPRGLGRDKVAMVGDITYTGDTLNLRDATLTLDKNTVAAAADITLDGPRPLINAKLSTGPLDLSGLSSSESGTGTAQTGWSRAPIDVSGLQALDAKIALTAASIKIGKTDLGLTSLYTTLDRGRAVTEIKQIEAYGGNIDGAVIVNSRGGLSTRINVKGSALAISKLFNELLGYDRLVATGNLAINVLGVGNDMHTLMNSLEGEGGFSTGAGELLGLDIVGMLRTLNPNFIGEGSKTIFDKISASFTVNQGVLRNDDLTLLAPLIAATGSGTVGLGAQTLNYRLEPRLLKDGNVRVPILITGTWAAPKFKLDLESLAKDRLKEEAREVEDRAKEELRKKLEQELGTPITDGRSVEDAVKRKLEDELKDGLLNLLGGN